MPQSALSVPAGWSPSAVSGVIFGAVLGVVLLALTALPAAGQGNGVDLDRAPPPVIAVGDVGSDSAVLWVQADREGTVKVELAASALPDLASGPEASAEGGVAVEQFQAELTAGSDYTAKLMVQGLSPGTIQHWRAMVVSAAGLPGEPARGSFRTAPGAFDPQPVHLAWGGDLAGQNVCRDARRGFEVFDAIFATAPELFIGLGDMIYADGLCEAVGRYGNPQIPGSFGQAVDLAGFRAHWRYSRADASLRRLLAGTAYYAVWDDHEVVNDFGPLHDTRDQPPYRAGAHLMPLGLSAMLEQNPVGESPLTPKRLYRSVRWGQHLELLLLDTRQYRDPNLAADTAERPKTLLGREQLTWLKERLASSDATWVVVASSVPMSIPTGWPEAGGRDGWADGGGTGGFSRELRAILAQAAASGRSDLLFISADVHFGAAFRYRPFAAQPEFVVHELISPPLSAGIGNTKEYDRGLGAEPLFRHAPESVDDLASYEQARAWLGFGEIRIDATGNLSAALRGVDGEPLYELQLSPTRATRLAEYRVDGSDCARHGGYGRGCSVPALLPH
jgi:alkaline phosphatase D